MPRPLQAPRRGREARRAAGGRLPSRAASDLALGVDGEANDYALPQLSRHGDGRAHPLATGGWCCADGRLRQDHAWPHTGRYQRRRAHDLYAGRPDAARQLARQGFGLRLRRLQVLGRAPRGKHLGERLGRDGGRHREELRRVHDHGDGLDYDGARRRARSLPAGHLLDPGSRQQSCAYGFCLRPAHRGNGVGRPHRLRRS